MASRRECHTRDSGLVCPERYFLQVECILEGRLLLVEAYEYSEVSEEMPEVDLVEANFVRSEKELFQGGSRTILVHRGEEELFICFGEKGREENMEAEEAHRFSKPRKSRDIILRSCIGDNMSRRKGEGRRVEGNE